MNQSINRIKDSLLAGQPIVQIISFEEKRVEGFLKKLCQQTLKNQNIYSWDSHNGLSRGDVPVPDSKDPDRRPGPGAEGRRARVLCLQGPHPAPAPGTPDLVRQMRECYLQFKGNRKFFSSSLPTISCRRA